MKPDTKYHMLCYSFLYEVFRTGKSVETVCRWVVAGALGWGGGWEAVCNRYGAWATKTFATR